MAASTSALPPHLPARREADVICGSCCFCCEAGHLWPCVLRPEPGGESAGCVLPAVLCSAGFVCLPAILPAIPTDNLIICPRQVCFAPFSSLLCLLHLFHVHVRQDRHSSVRASSLSGPAVCCQGQQFASCENCPIGSCNTGLQWRPVHRSI